MCEPFTIFLKQVRMKQNSYFASLLLWYSEFWRGRLKPSRPRFFLDLDVMPKRSQGLWSVRLSLIDLLAVSPCFQFVFSNNLSGYECKKMRRKQPRTIETQGKGKAMGCGSEFGEWPPEPPSTISSLNISIYFTGISFSLSLKGQGFFQRYHEALRVLFYVIGNNDPD